MFKLSPSIKVSETNIIKESLMVEGSTPRGGS